MRSFLFLFLIALWANFALATNFPIGLAPTIIVNAQTTASSITSPTMNIYGVGNIDCQLLWTGTTNGTTSANVSEDGTNWDPLTLNGSVTPAGSSGHGTIELTQLAAPFLQIAYSASSGTGAMTITCFAKNRQ